MNNLTIYNKELVKIVESNKLADVIKPLVKEIFLKTVAVEDVTFGENNVNLTKVIKGQEVVLKRVDTLYDKHSVYVFTTQGDSLGEINEFDNQMVANLMDAGKKLKALVDSSCSTYDGSYLKIQLYLMDF